MTVLPPGVQATPANPNDQFDTEGALEVAVELARQGVGLLRATGLPDDITLTAQAQPDNPARVHPVTVHVERGTTTPLPAVEIAVGQFQPFRVPVAMLGLE